MFTLSESFCTAVEKIIDEIEAKSDVEIVVVFSRKSAEYLDIPWKLSVALCWLLMCLLFLLDFRPTLGALCIDLPIILYGGQWIIHKVPSFWRHLITKKRKLAHVQKSAAAAFQAEKIYGSPHRNGILIYLSALEDRIEVLLDGGLWGKLPLVDIQTLAWKSQSDDPHLLGSTDDFLKSLRELGDLCTQHHPLKREKINHIPNAVRVLS